MCKEVRGISCFLDAPPRVFAPAVWAAPNHTRTHKFPQLSIYKMFHVWWKLTADCGHKLTIVEIISSLLSLRPQSWSDFKDTLKLKGYVDQPRPSLPCLNDAWHFILCPKSCIHRRGFFVSAANAPLRTTCTHDWRRRRVQWSPIIVTDLLLQYIFDIVRYRVRIQNFLFH